MNSIFIGIIAIIVGGILFIIFTKGKSTDEDEESATFMARSEPQHQPVHDPRPSQFNSRQFTLAELKRAEPGRYSWDETGCVFEINSDGSVTIVGHFDPAELRIDPVQEMYDRLIDAGLSDMLPNISCFHAFNYTGGETDQFVAACNDDVLSSPSCPYTVNGINEVTFSYSSFDGAGKAIILFNLSKTGEGILILMPSNEKEYILSLGAMACVERIFGNKVRIRISSPAVMGAFGIAIARTIDISSRISFAVGEGENYLCCNMLVDDDSYVVKKLLHRSIIQPTKNITALQHIAKGCMAQSLILQGLVKGYFLHDMMPYTMSLLLKEYGRTIKIYDLISESVNIPTRQGDKNIFIGSNKSLSFIIGSNELIEDIITEYNIPYGNGNIEASIEINAEMDVILLITSNGNEYKIKPGELIG